MANETELSFEQKLNIRMNKAEALLRDEFKNTSEADALVLDMRQTTKRWMSLNCPIEAEECVDLVFALLDARHGVPPTFKPLTFDVVETGTKGVYELQPKARA